ncbi:MAG: TldD/PmbA family protein [Anaerolineae bacterium]
MLGEARIRELADVALAASTADETEVVFMAQDSALTRFANSAIHQNVAERNTSLTVRVVKDRRVGVASTNDLGRSAIEDAVAQAERFAEFQPEIPDWTSLPGPASFEPVDAFHTPTVGFTPEQRAEVVEVVCRQAQEKGVNASGAFETAGHELAVANSLGVWAYGRRSQADYISVIMSDSGAGYAAWAGTDASRIDPEALADEAIDKALRSRQPRDIEPGEYTVILESYAVATMISWLAYMGLSAQALLEERSFMTDRIGEQIADERISIWDDGHDPSGLPLAFDFEGVPKQRVELIKNGVANAVVWDTRTAARAGNGRQSTGHALPAPSTYGPMPLNLFMAAGDATYDDMLAQVERGLWVTRLNYVRAVHPKQTIITGMTRDGTFLVQGGEIVGPVKNLRFTQSILEAFSNLRAVGRETKLVSGFLGAVCTPAALVDGFTFTGVTQF